MDHTYIEENQIADRYVQGNLPEGEAEQFEEHYLSCPDCLDRLDLAESMQRGFIRMAAQDAAKLSAARQLAVVAWLVRLSRSRQIGVLLTAVLVFAFVPAGLSLRGFVERGRELAQARTALAEKAALRAELEASRRDLASERKAREEASNLLAQALQPQGNVPILFFDVERGAGPAAEPTQRLKRPEGSGWIFLDVTIEAPTRQPYGAVLRDAHGTELWRRADLRLSGRDSLSLLLPASLVPPGDYSLSIEGQAPGGKPTTAGTFTFRVLPPS